MPIPGPQKRDRLLSTSRAPNLSLTELVGDRSGNVAVGQVHVSRCRRQGGLRQSHRPSDDGRDHRHMDAQHDVEESQSVRHTQCVDGLY
jgi:hypothetical protein